MKRRPYKIKTRYKQKYLSEKLGVTQSTVSHWLNMVAKPSGLPKKELESKFPELYKRIMEKWNKISTM